MTAILLPFPTVGRSPDRAEPAADCRPAAGTRSRPSRPSRAVYRRRRLAVALVVAFAALTVRAVVFTFAGSPGVARPAPAVQPIGVETYRVQPGDTLWSIARQLQPHGDVRTLVDRLSDEHGGAPLRPGDVLTVP